MTERVCLGPRANPAQRTRGEGYQCGSNLASALTHRPLKLKVDTPINGVGEWIPHPRFQNLTPRGRQQAMASIVKHRGYPQEQWAELRKPRGRGGLARNSNGGRSAGRPMDSTGAAACLSGPETLAPHMKAGRGRTKDASVAHAWLSQGHRR